MMTGFFASWLWRHRAMPGGLMVAAMLALSGCASDGPDYAKPLPPGSFGLRKVTDPAKQPSLQPVANQMRAANTQKALKRSLQWFAKPSTRTYFPIGPISHGHAWASVYALQQIARNNPANPVQRLRSEFNIWESIGWDGKGTVFFTGYYSPVVQASRNKTGPYQYPLYQRPDDLVTEPRTGKVLGRRTEDGLTAYPTRRQLMENDMLKGQELVWLKDRFDSYLVQVNGSAKLRMRDGSTMHVGYAGSNGRSYTSIGRLLAKEGKLDEDTLSVTKLRRYFENNPGDLPYYIQKNDRFVFFKQYSGENWPAGSLGFKVTPMRSLATDKAIFPRACPVLVQTEVPNRTGGGSQSFNQLMVDQDTGGAIRAAGRADIYVGVGDQARALAGGIAAEGQMYYLILKRDRARVWYERLQRQQQTQKTARR
jgi:membrane-bound lytic murein transglycosylase A